MFHPSKSSPCVGMRTCSDYSPFGVELDGRTVSGGYRFGYNGKEKTNEILGEGNSYDFGARILDPRVGRWSKTDALEAEYPGVSPYSNTLNNPICFIDAGGYAVMKVDPPKKIGITRAKIETLTSSQIQTFLKEAQATKKTGLTIDYLTALAKEEKMSLNLYDRDGNTSYGGVTTIGIGHQVHLGAIGSTQYDSKALTKEAQFKDGITQQQAIDLFVNDLEKRVQIVRNHINNSGITIKDQAVFTVLVDIFFNAGTSDVKDAIETYKKEGKEGLMEIISNNSISNPSPQRKQFRLDILNGKIQMPKEESNQNNVMPFVPRSLIQDNTRVDPSYLYPANRINMNKSPLTTPEK